MISERTQNTFIYTMFRKTVFFTLLLVLLTACTTDDDMTELKGPVITYLNNPPLPTDADELRILAIGNSFTYDGTALIDVVAPALGIDKDRYCIYVVSHTGASLDFWYKASQQDLRIQPQRVAGNIRKPDIDSETTLRQAIAQDWDVIVLQQYSYNADKYNTFNPALHHLIDIVRTDCTNKDVALAWQSVWSYSDREEKVYSNSTARWKAICSATKKMVRYDGIDIVIPTGTAIENLRQVLESPGELTRDDWHLDFGVGRYTAACTWVERLFSPVFNTNITTQHTTFVPTDTNGSRYPCTPVTEDNIDLCVRSAYFAVQIPYALTSQNILNPTP